VLCDGIAYYVLCVAICIFKANLIYMFVWLFDSNVFCSLFSILLRLCLLNLSWFLILIVDFSLLVSLSLLDKVLL